MTKSAPTTPGRLTLRSEAPTAAKLPDGPAIPIRSVFGIGRNYAAHARELNNPVPDKPIVFLKPASSLLGDGGTIRLPAASTDVQHEVEIVMLLGATARHVSANEAPRLVAGYGVGIDVTARDLQRQAQRDGKPWTVAKGFDTFAPISRFIPAERVADLRNIAFELCVNGELRQSGNSRDMLFGCAEIIAYLSSIFTLQAGDLIFTGTPEGVGRIAAGDTLTAKLVELGISITVGARSAQHGW